MYNRDDKEQIRWINKRKPSKGRRKEGVNLGKTSRSDNHKEEWKKEDKWCIGFVKVKIISVENVLKEFSNALGDQGQMRRKCIKVKCRCLKNGHRERECLMNLERL